MIKRKSEKVSIIIPTFSRNDTLDRAIKSALGQTYQNIEIIIVDDNPPNSEYRKSTEHLMEKYSVNPKVRYCKNESNLGGAGARNNGIMVAVGDYIAFLDDDDEYYPQNIEKKLNTFLIENNDKLAIVYGHCEYINHGRVVYRDCMFYKGNCLYEAMQMNCIVKTSQWMAKKEALLKVGLFSLVPSMQDSQLLLKMLSVGYEITYVPEILSKYYMDFDQYSHITTNKRKVLEGELLYQIECRKLYDRLNEEQIVNVEYVFAKTLYKKYKSLQEIANASLEKERMYELCPKKAMYYFLNKY